MKGDNVHAFRCSAASGMHPRLECWFSFWITSSRDAAVQPPPDLRTRPWACVREWGIAHRVLGRRRDVPRDEERWVIHLLRILFFRRPYQESFWERERASLWSCAPHAEQVMREALDCARIVFTCVLGNASPLGSVCIMCAFLWSVLLLLLGDRFTEGLISGQRQHLRAPVRHHSYWHLLPNRAPRVGKSVSGDSCDPIQGLAPNSFPMATSPSGGVPVVSRLGFSEPVKYPETIPKSAWWYPRMGNSGHENRWQRRRDNRWWYQYHPNPLRDVSGILQKRWPNPNGQTE